jgi:N-acetylglucosaminyldiphosphoundecaprenol N-acetyl-beta-D-mannosaminyltransferase
LQEADLATADGMPLVWGARLLGVSLESRVAGADLVPALAGRAAQKGYKLYFLGAAPGIADRAAQIFQERYPGLQIVGVSSPPYSSVLEMDTSILDDIRAAQPDILLVAFGNPKQEKWIGMYRRQLKVPVMIGIGGTLDLIAGDKKRAPLWMQRFGLEWLFRLIQEPGRLWRRYVVDLLVFGTFFARQWWAMRQGRTPSMVLPSADLLLLDNKTAIMSLEGPLTIENYQPFVDAGQQALTTTPYILVDLSKTEFLDSAAIGALVGLAKQARDAGGDLALAGVPPDIQRTFSLLKLLRRS